MSNQVVPSVVEVMETTSQVEKQHQAAELLEINKDKKEGMIIERQKIPETRQSGRVQDQLLKKYKIPSPKKKVVEGNNISDQNSFGVLGNSEVISMASSMGVRISDMQFDKIDIMKDLEVARKALHASKQKAIVDPNVWIECEMLPKIYDNLLLGWKGDDSESEHFTLVHSRKKKRKLSLLENSAKGNVVRRSRRTTPSVYRNKGQEILNASPIKSLPRK
jgi:hypothetical protein